MGKLPLEGYIFSARQRANKDVTGFRQQPEKVGGFPFGFPLPPKSCTLQPFVLYVVFFRLFENKTHFPVINMFGVRRVPVGWPKGTKPGTKPESFGERRNNPTILESQMSKVTFPQN